MLRIFCTCSFILFIIPQDLSYVTLPNANICIIYAVVTYATFIAWTSISLFHTMLEF